MSFIVDFPIKHGEFSIVMLVYHRVFQCQHWYCEDSIGANHTFTTGLHVGVYLTT